MGKICVFSHWANARLNCCPNQVEVLYEKTWNVQVFCGTHRHNLCTGHPRSTINPYLLQKNLDNNSVRKKCCQILAEVTYIILGKTKSGWSCQNRNGSVRFWQSKESSRTSILEKKIFNTTKQKRTLHNSWQWKYIVWVWFPDKTIWHLQTNNTTQRRATTQLTLQSRQPTTKAKK